MGIFVEMAKVESLVTEKLSEQTSITREIAGTLVSQAFAAALGQPDAPKDPDQRYLVIEVDRSEPLLELAFRAVAERLPELMETRRRRLEDSDIEALLNVMLPASGGDNGKALAFDNARAREAFFREVPCLSSKAVAILAGHRAKNTSMTASRWKQAGKVFSVPRLGEDLYPEFQFRDGMPHPSVARVLAVLPKRKSPWQIAFWFTSSNSWLDGACPAERLDGDATLQAARHEAEDIVG